ncbi:MAG: indole-3-glycerol phosphate synthase TrpC [Eubacteriales bacterium]
MILDDIISKKKIRLKNTKQEKSLETLKNEAFSKLEFENGENKFYQAMSKDGLSVIGEIKHASPSTGTIDFKLNLYERVEKYSQSVDAISVLTEEDFFAGNIDIFKKVRKLTKKPLLRKDFIIDPYQIYESKAIGADAILLIATTLKEEQLINYVKLARQLKLEVLLEVHDTDDLKKAIKTNTRIIGINNRDLKDFTINLSTTKELCEYISDRLVVSESGIKTIDDIKQLKDVTINGVLVGTSLMKSSNPDVIIKEWKGYYDS